MWVGEANANHRTTSEDDSQREREGERVREKRKIHKMI